MNLEEFYLNYSKIMSLKTSSYVLKIPILKSYTDESQVLKSDTLSKLREKIKNHSRILDFGAGDRNFKNILDKLGIHCVYQSMDIDTSNQHDYHTLDEVKGSFNHVILFNLLEHLPFDKGLEYLTKAHDVLKSDGLIFISVPNIWHPNHMWRCDITHIKPYPFQDLYALLSYMGFIEIEIFRIHHRPFRFSLKNYLIHILRAKLHQIMDIDYTKDIWIIAKKG